MYIGAASLAIQSKKKVDKMSLLTQKLAHDTSYASEIEKSVVILGVWTVESVQTMTEDWAFYSKAWHRSHGPKKTVTGRVLTFSRKHGRGRINKSIEIKSYSGDFLANSINSLGLNKKPSKIALKIRLNKAYDAKLIKKTRGYKIYERTLLSQVVDYAVESPSGVVFHADKICDLIPGVHKKMRSKARKLAGVVDYKKCKKLGFCDAGIHEFCAVFGLDLAGNYTLAELEKIIRNDIEKAAPFLSELKILAAAFNYDVVEFGGVSC